MLRQSILTIFILIMASCAKDADAPVIRGYVSYPVKLDSHCRTGKARLYDECSDQLILFGEALARANAESKVLLVSYGAEWCIWCHVLDAHLDGATKKFRYTWASADEPDDRTTSTLYESDDSDFTEANRLRDFVSKSFVVVHIDAQFAPNGETVLQITGALEHAEDWIPFVFAVDKAGRYVSSLNHDIVEKRREGENWYRGYDRRKLIEQLTLMRNTVSGASGGDKIPAM